MKKSIAFLCLMVFLTQGAWAAEEKKGWGWWKKPKKAETRSEESAAPGETVTAVESAAPRPPDPDKPKDYQWPKQHPIAGTPIEHKRPKTAPASDATNQKEDI